MRLSTAARSLLAGLLVAGSLVALPTSAALAVPDVRRVAGTDRIATGVALSVDSFASAGTAVVAAAGTFADALAAAPLAAAAGGPVLLNPTASLDERVRAEVERLGADTVYLMGGPNAQSEDVRTALLAIDGVERVQRLSGPDRYATAAAAAREAVGLWTADGDTLAGDHVLVALGEHPVSDDRAFPDALTAGPLAGHARRPILLTRQGSVPEATQQALTDLETQVVTVIGGTGAIPDATADDLGDETVEKRRIGGTNRFETAVLVARRAVANGADASQVVLATGSDFPDGLAAGPSAFASGGVLLLVATGDLDASLDTRAALTDLGPDAVVRIAGGPKAVSGPALEQVRAVVTGDENVTLGLLQVASGLSQVLGVVSSPGDPRLFAYEQGGLVRIIDGGQVRAVPFLDLAGLVRNSGEQGLLGFAFHPDYPTDPRVFAHYSRTGDGDTVIAEFTRGAGADVIDESTQRILLTVDQPAPNHNGGSIAFGADRNLYVPLGDGGGQNDPDGNGENTATLLGSLLRLDVSTPGTAVPAAGNPFDGTNGRREIWAYGLRNPYRIAFDAVTRELVITDVGQGAWEEVDVAALGAGGRNYGWSTMEGAHCFGAATCDQTGRTLPVLEYANDSGTCAILGGHVYRGTAIPALRGRFLFGDLCAGNVRSARLVGETLGSQQDHTGSLGLPGLLGFGQDAAGEVYVTDGSTIWRFVAG